jgi:ketosteroid isomerase-like protein
VTKENVEIVRRVYNAAARRDAETVLALYDPEVELDASRIALGGLVGEPVRHGHDGVRSFFRDVHEAWDNLEYDVEELIEADEQVISVVTRRGRGRASGAGVEMHYALVWTLRDGKVARVAWFTTREEALRAAGLQNDRPRSRT